MLSSEGWAWVRVLVFSGLILYGIIKLVELIETYLF